eukprot:760416-Hanusia_phi.AAC.2
MQGLGLGGETSLLPHGLAAQAEVKEEDMMGVLRVSVKNNQEAYVSIPALKTDVFVDYKSRNGSFEGDVVLLEIVERTKSEQRGRDNKAAKEPGNHAGRVVRVVEQRHKTRHVGYLDARRCSNKQERFVNFIPHDRRYPNFRVERESCPSDFLDNPDRAIAMIVCAELVEQGAQNLDAELPLATLKDVVGESGDLTAETNMLLLQNGISTEPFSQEVLDSLPVSDGSWVIPERQEGGRREAEEVDRKVRDWMEGLKGYMEEKDSGSCTGCMRPESEIGGGREMTGARV